MAAEQEENNDPQVARTPGPLADLVVKARTGDRVVLGTSHVGEATRDGRVLEACGPEVQAPYLVA